MRSFTGPKRPGYAVGALLALAGAVGCGNQFRQPVTPVQPTGPAPEPIAYLVAFSQPNLQLLATDAANPCPNTNPATQPGVATLIDFSGDTILAQAVVGIGVQTFALDPTGTSAYSTNCDGTLSTAPITTTLQTKNILTTTLPSGQTATALTFPTNILVTSAGEYVTEPHPQDLGTQNISAVGALTNNTSGVPSLKQEVPVAPSLINLLGTATSQRVYAVSQGNSIPNDPGTNVQWGQCGNPASVQSNGEVDGIETSSLTVSSQIPVGKCPVFGLMTPDGRRAFIMNRGSGTLSVIDTTRNVLDTGSPSQFLQANATIPVGTGATSGPVHADYYAPASLLVTANYDDDTVSIINVSINGAVQGFTDTANFGQVLATVSVGHHPTAVSILQDGSRAYIANEGTLGDGGNGTVSIVNLSSFTVETTLPVSGHPRSIASTFNAPIGKVYTAAQDSPFVTVIRTDTDIVSASIQLQGNGVDLHTTTQFAGATSATTTANAITQSRSAGSGAP